jgi:catecholate siderophore receptor
MNSGSKPLLLGAASLIAPAIANPAMAAETAPQQTDLGSFAVTDTVVVSGTYKADRQSSPKATADLVDTPRSITVVTRQVLEDTSSTTLAEALRTVPGITLGAGEGGNPLGDRPFLRGSDSSNSIYLDGVRDIAATSRETFAVEAIEITRGSDGITNGSGNAGGSINIVTKRPEKRFFNVDATYGTKITSALPSTSINRSAISSARVAAMPRSGRRRPRLYLAAPLGHRALAENRHDRPDQPDARLLSHAIERIARSGHPLYPHRLRRWLYRSRAAQHRPFTTATGGRSSAAGEPLRLVNRDFRTTNTDGFGARFETQLAKDLKLRNTLRYTNTEQDYLWTQPDDSRGNLYNYGTISRRVNARYSTQDGLSISST